MIQATARILRNIVEVRVGDAVWLARPIEAESGRITGRIAALFSTEYHLYRPDDPMNPESTISYRAKNDEIRIQVGEESWKTRSSAFGPMTIDYAGVTYTIVERLTGKFAILDGTSPVALGQLGYRSCAIREYRPEVERFLTHLALGYVIRTLTWEMFYS